MGINPVGPGQPVTRLQGSMAITSSSGPMDAGRKVEDKVQVSDATRWVDAARELPEVRQSKVDAARAAIAAGKYDDPAVLDATLNRLLEEEF